ncbi:GL18047 [Drosophila persimilis]|uniref:GL18047 n=1 Tax=Drosophila persimilis TaxID=7234 RepID=B4H2C1_DROPE|nr:GL18047 [Drosophila persimilis]
MGLPVSAPRAHCVVPATIVLFSRQEQIGPNIYWSDTEARLIEVARLDGTSRRSDWSTGDIDQYGPEPQPRQGRALHPASDCPNLPLPVSSKNIRAQMSAAIGLLFGPESMEQHCRLGGFVYWLDDKTGLERITVNGERRSVELQRLSQFTGIRAVWTPDAKVLRGRPNCFHICLASGV